MKDAIASIALAAVVALAGAAAQPAAAAIKCNGPYQIVQGNEIATPYCEDNYIAYVASHYHGIAVSPRAVRQNPNLKRDICRRIGHDIRVKAYCLEYLYERRLRR